MTTSTLTSMLEKAAESGSGFRFLDRHEDELWLDFGEVHERAGRVASRLLERGVEAGERVALIAPTSPEFVSSFFGILRAGAVPVPLYPPVRLGRLDEYVSRTSEMLRAVDAVGLVADSRTRRVLGEVVERARPRLGVLDASELSSGHRATSSADFPTREPDDLAFVQFSSGTTGSPSPVGLTHRQVLANVDAILSTFPEEVLETEGVCWLPLYHDMGLIGCVMVALRVGRPLTLIPPELFLAKPAIWLRALSRYGAAVSPAPNFAYGRCLDRVTATEIDELDLSSWRIALNGAEPVSAQTMRAFQDRFAPAGLRPEALTPVYGLAEAALAVTFSDIDAPFDAARFDRAALGDGRVVRSGDGIELTALGRPLDGFDIAIRDDGGARLPEDTVGRLHVRGPSITSGYLGGQEAPLRKGWLDTGDVGFLHEGQLYVHARAKDVVIVRGRNHAPHDIERACDDVDGVRTGCQVAVSEIGEHGERLLVFVEYREERDEMAEECRRSIRSRTGLDPDLVVMLEPGTLPRTSSGKLRRSETLKRWQSGELVPPRSVNALRLAGAMAKSMIGYLRSRT